MYLYNFEMKYNNRSLILIKKEEKTLQHQKNKLNIQFFSLYKHVISMNASSYLLHFIFA